MNSNISFTTRLPKTEGSPRITIYDVDPNEQCSITLSDTRTNESYTINNVTDGVYTSNKQWFGDWRIIVNYKGKAIHYESFNLEGKTSFVKLDSYALGDTLAWIPYVEEFRKKYKCKVICSTFHNHLLVDTYPDIMFIQPNIQIDNVYHQIYVGASDDNNTIYSPVNSKEIPLQSLPCHFLNLDYTEINPNLNLRLPNIKPFNGEKYVCISEFASGINKMWNCIGGWQKVVDYLNDNRYKVVVISKEKTVLNNVIDMSGDNPIIERCYLLKHANFFIGVSSALSWLSWSLGTHVVMISDVTPIDHEFQSNITRITKNPHLKNVDYTVSNFSDYDDVINRISEIK